MLKTNDGYELFTQFSQTDNAKGTIIFSHGFVEYAAHYSRLHKLFNAQGYNFFKYDLRGHGRTTAPIGVHYTHFTDDLNQCVQWVKQETNLPVFVMGFSLGGLITSLYTYLHPYEIQGQILLGPGLKGSKRFLEHTNQELSVHEVLTTLESKEDAGITRLLSLDSPYILKSIPLEFAQQMFYHASKQLWDNVHQIRISTLIFHGKHDPMIAYTYSASFYDQIASIDKTFELIEDAEHDLLRTKFSETIVEEISQWCDQRL